MEKGKVAKVEQVALSRLPSTREAASRAETLADNGKLQRYLLLLSKQVLILDCLTDHELGRLLETLDGDYTVVFFSDPNEFKAYEPDFADSVHMDLKRQSESPVLIHSRQSNSTRDLPLFEKYQFFTPGEFPYLAITKLGFEPR